MVLTGGKKNVQAVVRAPGVAAEAVSDALGTVGRAATSLREGAYGAADSVSRLASAPAEMADKRRRQQQVRLDPVSTVLLGLLGIEVVYVFL